MLSVLGHPMPFPKIIIAYFVIATSLAAASWRNVSQRDAQKTRQCADGQRRASGIRAVIYGKYRAGFTLALLSAVAIHRYMLIVLGVAAVYSLVLLVINSRRETHAKSHNLLNRIPLVSVSKAKFMKFIGKNQTLLSGKNLVVLLVSSLISSTIAITALYVCAQSFGVELNPLQAVIAFTLPMILQNLTFIPGGFGINEQSSVGILLLIGVSLPGAVAL